VGIPCGTSYFDNMGATFTGPISTVRFSSRRLVADDFLVDTGALHSVLTDREAKKLGLTIGNDIGVLTGASGDTLNFRTAVAKFVTVGATSFRDVSFAVLEPTGPRRDAEGGVVGMPMLLGVGSIRWSKDGTAELGRSIPHVKQDQPNLVFDRGRLLLRSEFLAKLF
jgi:gag-polyprotein putative aspartyl protease